MRVLDDQATDAMHKEVLTGAAKGLAISTVLAVGGAVLAQRYSPYFRNLGAGIR